jgi:hypothetical protein
LVAESVTPVDGVFEFGPTKGHERREVPIPRFLIDDLAPMSRASLLMIWSSLVSVALLCVQVRSGGVRCRGCEGYRHSRFPSARTAAYGCVGGYRIRC